MPRGSILGLLLLPSSPSPESLRGKLEKAKIERLFAGGPDDICRIYEYVSEPWRAWFLGHRPQSIEGMARLVVRNLDWYLEPPAPLFKREWLYQIVILVASVVGVAGAVGLHSLGSHALLIIWVILLLALLGASPARVAVSLVVDDLSLDPVNVDVLRKYLREIFRDSGIEVPAAEGEGSQSPDQS